MAKHICKHCGHSFSVPDWLETALRCPQCGRTVGQGSPSQPASGLTSLKQQRTNRLRNIFHPLWAEIRRLIADGLRVVRTQASIGRWRTVSVGVIGCLLVVAIVVVRWNSMGGRSTSAVAESVQIESPNQATPAEPDAGSQQLPSPAPTGEGNAGNERKSLKGEEIYERTLRSTVWIIVNSAGAKGSSGTGCLIDAESGHVLTNMHVVDDASEAFIFLPKFDSDDNLIVDRRHYLATEKPLTGKIIRTRRDCDLALIELDMVPPAVQPIKLATRSVKPGQNVYTLGNPGASGALWIFTSGTVRQVYDADFRVEGYRLRAKVVETQNPINPGDSGGPVVNDLGELVAITQSILTDAQLVSHFIDISEIRAFLSQAH